MSRIVGRLERSRIVRIVSSSLFTAGRSQRANVWRYFALVVGGNAESLIEEKALMDAKHVEVLLPLIAVVWTEFWAPLRPLPQRGLDFG